MLKRTRSLIDLQLHHYGANLFELRRVNDLPAQIRFGTFPHRLPMRQTRAVNAF